MQRYYVWIIVFFALLVRIFALNSYPPSLNWDEVSHGYNAYSILQTGKDEWGEPFPTIFRAYGDYKLPIYIYLTVLSEAIFGINAFAVRLPSVLAGVATVIFSYLLVKKLFRDEKTALLTSFLVAIEPWSFFLSRVALEANVALFLIVSGVYFFIYGLEKKKWWILSAVLLGLSVWTYNSARIFTPLLVVSLIFIYRKSLLNHSQRYTSFLASGIAVLFFVPMFLQLINSSGQARYGWVRILDEGAIAQIEEQRNMSTLNPTLTKLIYNRPVYFTTQVVSNYLSHFSPKFLFFEGGSNYQFNVPGIGLLHLINLPLFYIGIILTLKNIKNKNYQLLLLWLLLAPLAASLTREAPHTLRNIVFLPLPMLFTSLAVIKLFNKKWLPVYLFVVLIFFGLYVNKYIDYTRRYSQSWQYGNKEMVEYVKENYHAYDNIIITKNYGEPHEFILFYWPWNPDEYQNDSELIRFSQSNWYWVDRFDKFYFINEWEVPTSGDLFTTESKITVSCEDKRCLLVTSENNAPDNWNKIKEVNFLDGEKAYEFYEN